MKLKIVILAMAFLLCNACNKDDATSSNPISTSINKIMPLGASRVEGARPEFITNRYYNVLVNVLE